MARSRFGTPSVSVWNSFGFGLDLPRFRFGAHSSWAFGDDGDGRDDDVDATAPNGGGRDDDDDDDDPKRDTTTTTTTYDDGGGGDVDDDDDDDANDVDDGA